MSSHSTSEESVFTQPANGSRAVARIASGIAHALALTCLAGGTVVTFAWIGFLMWVTGRLISVAIGATAS
jgi:hypothetical protein